MVIKIAIRKTGFYTIFLILFSSIFYFNVNMKSESGHIVINEFELNPPGNDNYLSVEEWVELYNPTSTDIDISGWTLSTTHGKTVTVYIPQGTVIKAHGYYVYSRGSQWLDNDDESIILRDSNGNEIDRTPVKSDNENDDRTWARYPNGKDTNSDSDWRFQLSTRGSSNGGESNPPPQPQPPTSSSTSKFAEVDTVATVYKVVDGDTFDAFPVGRIRLADINTPEKGEPGYSEARDFLKSLIYNRQVYLDVDDINVMDKYNRLVCLVYIKHNSTHLLNVNLKLLLEGYAEIKDYPNEFNPTSWTLFVRYSSIDSLKDNDKLLSDYLKIKMDYKKLSEKYYDLLENYTVLEYEYNSLLSKYNILADKFNILSKNYSSLENEYNLLRNQYDELQLNYTYLKKNHDSLKDRYSSLEIEYSSLKNDYNNLSNRYNLLESKCKSLEEENYRLCIVFAIIITIVTMVMIIILIKYKNMKNIPPPPP